MCNFPPDHVTGQSQNAAELKMLRTIRAGMWSTYATEMNFMINLGSIPKTSDSYANVPTSPESETLLIPHISQKGTPAELVF